MPVVSSVQVVHELVSELDYPMFIVTAATESERAGCLIGFATQCSINPPRFLVCLSDKNRTYRVAREAEVLVVHLVPSHADALAELFGSQTGDDVDKFAEVAWHPGPNGTPVLDDCANWFAGRILSRTAVGDHVAFLLEPFAAESDGAERGFTFHRAKRMEPGHEA
jgi:flavin reductase (DIM6/NTAB) family NADH-FMN oxidoreductase RutF